jgi:monothiol glutaredoxin
MWNKDRVAATVQDNKLVLFTKGSRYEPMCGFSKKAIDILSRLTQDFEVINIFDDPNIRPSLIAYSNWPTTPQLFIDGELIGGSDIMEELYHSGELKQKVDAAVAT